MVRMCSRAEFVVLSFCEELCQMLSKVYVQILFVMHYPILVVPLRKTEMETFHGYAILPWFFLDCVSSYFFENSSWELGEFHFQFEGKNRQIIYLLQYMRPFMSLYYYHLMCKTTF